VAAPGGHAHEETKMATDAKQLVNRMFEEIINNGRVELMDELFDPALVTHTQQGDMDRDAFRQFVLAWRSAFPDIECSVSQLIQEGDRCSWTIRATGTHKGEFMGIPATGKSIDFLSMNYAIVRDGRGLEHWVLMDLPAMMAQLGAMPQPV
jgi:steroid delta-isomerase-like uncharacterized protein